MGACTLDFSDGIVAYLPPLRRFAQRLTRNTATAADDLVQDCMVRALTKWHQFQPGTNLQGWLFAIMRTTFVNDVRQRPSDVPLPLDDFWSELATAPTQEKHIEFTDFLEAFARISPNRQETVRLVGWHGKSYGEAARKMGVPIGTVRSRVSRARKELRDRLDGAVVPPPATVSPGTQKRRPASRRPASAVLLAA